MISMKRLVLLLLTGALSGCASYFHGNPVAASQRPDMPPGGYWVDPATEYPHQFH
jgi:hypothetical protein